MKKIGVFGGTFNPPHLGHLKLAGEIADKLSLNEVIVVPTYSPPHKTPTNLAVGSERLEMCRMTFQKDSRFCISDIEIARGGRSYTIDTIIQLKNDYPDAELFLIIGSDMLLSFDKWRRCEDLLNLCTVCAAERDSENEPIKKHGIPKIFNVHNLIIAEISPINVSSTAIREMVKNGEDIGAYVTQEVKEYIANQRLYLK